MLSRSNNRSPIMMNIKDKSPIKKICKAARKGTNLAATAAHNGSQLYEHVQTRIAEVDKDKCPSRYNRRSAASSSNTGMDSDAYRSRVRDQINRFNSAGAGENKKELHYHRQHDKDGCKNLIASADSNLSPSSYDTNPVEKENDANKSVSLSTTTSSYSFTNKDGIKALSPALHRQRRKSPKKASSPQKTSSLCSSQKKSPSSRKESSPTPKRNTKSSPNETEQLKMQLQALEKDKEKLMKRNSRLERKNEKLIKEVEEKAERSTSSRISHTDVSKNDCHKPTADISRDVLSNKRDPEVHPLIDSPLRKHMKTVHESAQSNCTVTMTKAPFPLLPPEESRTILEARKRENEEVSHMDMPGNVKGKPSLEVDANFALSYKKRQEKRSTDGESEEEEAVDLLTSAAFMFKTSRRNLL